MNDLKIADFNIRVDVESRTFSYYSTDYSFAHDRIACFVEITEDDIKWEDEMSDGVYRRGNLVCSAVLRKVSEWLPNNNAFLFHSVTIDVDGTGVAFAAVSGTGKSTHMMLWQKYLGDHMTVVNGDKPIVRFFDEKSAAELDADPDKRHDAPTIPGIPYAYGTPWMGKEGLGCNMRTPLRHICFIERSETNYVEEINSSDAIARIFNQVYMPADPAARIATVPLVDRLLQSCKLWIIHCNMEPEAAEVAYKTIFNK